ncbi:hypothetical protein [Actinocrispum sp. NPDC049592]|uniref:hypothetical protein n=1 Tax=Actinocrispum sp. NPDC049592 TaxID=3154835 RepID=UPI00343BD6F1
MGDAVVAAAAAAEGYDTARTALWIGGAQWAGKTTVARILAYRHRLTAYHWDYFDVRTYTDRLRAAGVETGPPDWVNSTPADLATRALDLFPRRFEYTLEDLRGLVSPHPVLAEGWGLRPELVAPLLSAPTQMIVMVPTDEFRAHQIRTLPRAQAVGAVVTNPGRAQRNRLARDRLIATDAVESARRLGIRVLEVDGSQDAEAVADILTDHFRPHLP